MCFSHFAHNLIFLYPPIFQCDQWCHSVKELTETPPTPETTSVQHAGSLISQTDAVMKQMAQRQLNTLKELASCLPEKQVKKMTQKTIQK